MAVAGCVVYVELLVLETLENELIVVVFKAPPGTSLPPLPDSEHMGW
jgi:hypothetical protein